MTQLELAQAAHVSVDMIARIEAGVNVDSRTARSPSLKLLARLAEALNVHPARLMLKP